MGTSMAFYSIMNKGFTPEDLSEKMKVISDHGQAKTDMLAKLLEQFVPPDKLEEFRKNMANESPLFGDASARSKRENRPAIAYNKRAGWLPLFEENLCEGNCASDDELMRLYGIFGAPVLAFSIFDSDVLFVSYIDDKQNIYNHAKPNFEEFEEYDAELYSKEFPEFLTAFCDSGGHAQLREIWENEDYVFADDRMHNIHELLGIEALYNSNEIPEGYNPIFANLDRA